MRKYLSLARLGVTTLKLTGNKTKDERQNRCKW